MLWVDTTDPEVLAVVAGDDQPSDLTSEAIAVASEILTLATGFKVHPAGEITEQFVSTHARRFSLVWGPVTSVSRVVRIPTTGDEQPLPYRQVGQMIYLHFDRPPDYSIPLWRTNWIGTRHYFRPQHLYEVTYQFGSTITPAALRSLEIYAHELYLAFVGSDECGLPERVTSITREGLGIELMTPQDFLDKGRTGLPTVDTWLAGANPSEGAMRGVSGRPPMRPSQVFTPDSPPGIGTRMKRLP